MTILNSMKKKLLVTIAFGSVVFGSSFAAHASSVSEHMVQKIGNINATDLGHNLYLLIGTAGHGNVLLSTGKDGNFVIDDFGSELTADLFKAIDTISPGGVDFVLNTHWHYDHTGSNQKLGEANATIIAHTNVRERLSSPQQVFGMKFPEQPKAAIPVITFDETLHIHLNDKDIEAVYVPGAHSDSDSIYFFTKVNMVHMGDTFINQTYPFFDLGNGGSVQGVITGLTMALGRIDDETIVFPGHGPIATKADLTSYRDFLQTMLSQVSQQKSAGKSLEEIQSMGLTSKYDAVWGGGMISSDFFVAELFNTLQ